MAPDVPGPQVVGMPDSGFIMYYEASPTRSIKRDMRALYALMNASGALPPACIAAHAADPAACILSEAISPTLRTPTFPLQSQYDAWQVRAGY